MDSDRYTALTGRTPDSAFSFDDVAEMAQSELEGLLGYPLDPEDWDNQYLENGKTQTDCSCPDDDATNLASPDEVVGSYRLFKWHSHDPFLAIDPAISIHKVKLVKDGITYRTFDPDEYTPQWTNGAPAFAKYIATYHWKGLFCLCGCNHWGLNHLYQLAVDADWGFEDTPSELERVLATMISNSLDTKDNIRSESVTSHSYTKFDKTPIAEQYASIIAKYAGPNGRRPSLV